MKNILEIKDLTVGFCENTGWHQVLNKISFDIGEGEIVGIVGESGSGKSMTALTIMHLLAENAVIKEGEILFDGQDLLKCGDDRMRCVQGNDISMIFQEPMTSLNPVQKIGTQIGEALRLHTNLNNDEIQKRVIESMENVGLPKPAELAGKYPYQLSGGMRQRVMIAMASICSPKLLIADEPTTALDVTVQMQILKLLRRFHDETGTSILFISHDLNVVRALCDRVIVMYRGDIVETGDAVEVLRHPKHDYTKTLVAAIPKNTNVPVEKNPVVSVKNLNVYYNEGRHLFSASKKKKHVIKNISFDIYDGEILGVVGESGCGKSTLGKTLTGLNRDYTGEITMACKRPQMVFQDPFGSLNPAKKLGWIMEEPLKLSGIRDKKSRIAMVDQMLCQIGLDESYKNRYAHELSGGQRQRVSIGLALLAGTKFIVADEPVSALDVTVQSQILDLILDIHKKQNVTMMFISHDLNVVRGICHRVIVMYLGEIVEVAEVHEIYEHPRHPYTQLLLKAILNGDGRVPAGTKNSGKTTEEVNNEGCAYYPRCPYHSDECLFHRPEMKNAGTDKNPHLVKCYHMLTVD